LILVAVRSPLLTRAGVHCRPHAVIRGELLIISNADVQRGTLADPRSESGSNE
jgi:hypothetical protein